MYRNVKFGNSYILIRPYTTAEELKLLEFLTFTEYDDDSLYEPVVDEIIEKCVKLNFSINKKIEKILLLLCIRKITLGDEFNLEFKCPHCKNKQSKTLQLSDIVSNASDENEHIKHEFIESSKFNINIDELEGIDDVDIDEYEYITEHICDYFTVYNDIVEFKCNFCGKESKTDIMTYKFILSTLSDDSFSSLTSWIHALVYIGKHTRSDVLQMTPVQRMMELKYFKESIKENTSEQI